MKYEIGKFVEAKSGSLTNWYEGQIVGYDDTNGVYVLHMCEKYPFTRYAGFSEDRIREVSEPTVIHVVLNSSPLGDLNHMREKMGREPLNEIDTEQLEQNIEAKAEELFYIFHTGDDTQSWGRLADKSGFRAIARHLATPQTDVQHALQAALESERELMDILRKIGKVFGKNVGTDIGILDLPKLVEGELIKTDEDNGGYRGKIDKLLFWLSSHNLTKPGVCVTDTIIELLEKAVSPKAPTPQLINASRVMNAIHIKPELRGGMTEDRIIENLEILHRDAAEGDSFRKFAINNLDFGAHIKPNQIRTGLAKRHENYKSIQKKLKDISEIMKTK